MNLIFILLSFSIILTACNHAPSYEMESIAKDILQNKDKHEGIDIIVKPLYDLDKDSKK